MKKKELNKEAIIKSIIKMMSDKEDVRSYIKGKIPLEALTKKGIKLAKPL
jgi:hypothetical protein